MPSIAFVWLEINFLLRQIVMLVTRLLTVERGNVYIAFYEKEEQFQILSNFWSCTRAPSTFLCLKTMCNWSRKAVLAFSGSHTCKRIFFLICSFQKELLTRNSWWQIRSMSPICWDKSDISIPPFYRRSSANDITNLRAKHWFFYVKRGTLIPGLWF